MVFSFGWDVTFLEVFKFQRQQVFSLHPIRIAFFHRCNGVWVAFMTLHYPIQWPIQIELSESHCSWVFVNQVPQQSFCLIILYLLWDRLLPPPPGATVLVGVFKSCFDVHRTPSTWEHPVFQILILTPVKHLLGVTKNVAVFDSNSHRSNLWLHLCIRRRTS